MCVISLRTELARLRLREFLFRISRYCSVWWNQNKTYDFKFLLADSSTCYLGLLAPIRRNRVDNINERDDCRIRMKVLTMKYFMVWQWHVLKITIQERQRSVCTDTINIEKTFFSPSHKKKLTKMSICWRGEEVRRNVSQKMTYYRITREF